VVYIAFKIFREVVVRKLENQKYWDIFLFVVFQKMVKEQDTEKAAI